MDPLFILLAIGVIFFFGLLSSLISNKIKLPNMLLLILAGIFLANLPIFSQKTPFDDLTLVSTISTIALVLIVFSYTSRFRIKDFDSLSTDAGLITLFSVIFTLITVSLLVHFVLGLNLVLSLVFASTLVGTDPSAVAQFLPNVRNKSIKLLFVESIINSPITVLAPIVFLDFVNFKPVSGELLTTFFTAFLSQVIVGIGSGFVIGLVFFKFMRKSYSASLSPLALITAALLAYGLAEYLSGNGVFAVTTLGLFYGTVSIKNKFVLSQYSRVISDILEIFVFILIGFLFKVKLINWKFVLELSLIFGTYLLMRWLAVLLALRKSTFSKLEKHFITFLPPKGVVTVVIILTIALTGNFPEETINLLIGFIVLSQLFSTIFVKMNAKKITDYSKVKLRNFSKNIA
ncbi:MAG: hypothetical protein PWP03_98 [Candidatus Woesearchaeota archaeon]|nr:hypothetical protein [Candidatus Woesearchaeota archaeon]